MLNLSLLLTIVLERQNMKELGMSKKFEQISGESNVNYQRGAKAARLALT